MMPWAMRPCDEKSTKNPLAEWVQPEGSCGVNRDITVMVQVCFALVLFAGTEFIAVSEVALHMGEGDAQGARA
jgi:hypothetical protein